MKHLKLYEGFEKSDYYQELNFEQNLKWTSIHKFLEPMPKEEITWLMDRFPSNLYEEYGFVYKDKKSLTKYAIKPYNIEWGMTIPDVVYGISLGCHEYHLHIERHSDEYYHIIFTTKFGRNQYRQFVCDQFEGGKVCLRDLF